MKASPIDAFVAWFSNLPVEQRVDIAALAGQFVPGFEAVELTADMELLVASFLERVNLSKGGSRMTEAGMALSLRAFVGVFIVRKRASREDWDKVESSLQQLSVDHNNPKFEDASRKIPLRREQWVRTAKQWKTVVEGPLSDESLNLWVDRIPFG